MYNKRIYTLVDRIRQNRTVLNGLLFTVFSFMSSGVNFILLIALTKFLTPSEYGYLNLFNTFVMLMAIFISFNAEKIIIVNYFKVGKQHTTESIFSIISLSLLLLSVYVLVILFSRDFLEAKIGFSILFLILAIVSCFFDKISGIIKAIWKAETNLKDFGVFSLITIIIECVLTILLLYYSSLSWESRVLAQFFVWVIAGIISLFILKKKSYFSFKTKFSFSKVKEALSFGVPLVPNTLSWWAMQGVNRFIINSYYGPAEVGMFSFAMNFSNIIQIISTAFAQSWHVDVFQHLAEKKNGYIKYLSSFTRKMIVVYFFLSIIFYVGVYFLIMFFFQPYGSSLKFLLPLTIGAFAHSLSTLFDCYLFYFKKTTILMNVAGVVSIINVALGFIIIKYDLMFAAYISMISEILITLMCFYYSQKYVKLKIV